MPIQQSCHLTTITMTLRHPVTLFILQSSGCKAQPAGTQHVQVLFSNHATLLPPLYAPWTHVYGAFSLSLALSTTHNTSTMGTNATSTTMPPRYHHDNPSDALLTHVCEVFWFLRALAAKHNELVHDMFMTGTSVNLTITPPCYHHYGPLDALWTLFAGFFLSREGWQQPAHNTQPAKILHQLPCQLAITTMTPQTHPELTFVSFLIIHPLMTTCNKPAHDTSTMGTNVTLTTMPPCYHHDNPSDTPWSHLWGYLILYALAITWQTGTWHVCSGHKCQIGCHATSPSPSQPLHHQSMDRKTKNNARIATGRFGALQQCRTQSGASSTQYWSCPTARESCKTPWSVSSL